MGTRCFQIFLPDASRRDRIDEVLEGHKILGTWRDDTLEDHLVVHILVKAEESEPILDQLVEACSDLEDFRVLLLPVEAVVPRPESVEEVQDDSDGEPGKQEEHQSPPTRISREELYSEVTATLDIDRVFVAMVIASAVVAAVGLLRNDVAVIIGAMVIAPLLGPNIAMSLAATLGDWRLFLRALITSVVGVALSLAVSITCGLVWGIETSIPAIASRTHFDYSDLALALAAGSAGTFAFTRGLSGAVIGVMVAVALVPPLVVFGMLLGAGEFPLAMRSGLLVLGNVVCINFAGIVTFLGQGVGPRTWAEKSKAQKSIAIALVFWLVMLIALAVILYCLSSL